MAGETSPVYAPSSSQKTSCAATVMPVPAAACTASARPVNGGATTTSRSSRPAQPAGQLAHEGRALAAGLVHLPVAGDERDARPARSLLVHHRSTCPPGRPRPAARAPSMNSSDAPPPMETWSILSASPNLLTAATESPPPDHGDARGRRPSPRPPPWCRRRTAPSRTRPSGRSRRPSPASAMSARVVARPSPGRCPGPSSPRGWRRPPPPACAASFVEPVGHHDVAWAAPARSGCSPAFSQRLGGHARRPSSSTLRGPHRAAPAP